MADWVQRHSPFRGAVRDHVDPALMDAVTATNAAAEAAALRRLSRIYAAPALDRPRDYLPAASAHPWPDATRPIFDLDAILDDICSSPRTMARELKPRGLEVVVKSSGAPVRPEDLGTPVELDSDSFLLDPARLRECVTAGGSVELRQFDRHCPRWASLVDDMAVVSGADVYLKLFLAGGDQSANGWHHDSTDVLSTTVTGGKRFQISPPSGSDAVVVDHTIRPGDTVRVPRGWEHCVTPIGEVSALVSAGLVRVADWAYRGEVPRHLGMDGLPSSPARYRLSLRPHVPPSTRAIPQNGGVVRSRIIGGIFLNGQDRAGPVISANGASFVLQPDAFDLLLAIHGAGVTPAAEVCRSSAAGEAATAAILRMLCEAGLVSLSEH